MKKLISFVICLVFAIGISVPASAAATTTGTTQPTTSAKKVSVAVPKTFKVVENFDNVTLTWKRNKNVKGYVISRSTDYEKWSAVKTITKNKTTKYVDYTASDDTLYFYSIKAYKVKDNKNYYSNQSTVIPVFYGVNFYLTTYKDSVMLNWSKIKNATGYELYFSEDSINYKRIKRIKNNEQVAYTKTCLEPMKNDYSFYMKAYKTIDGKKSYIYQSNYCKSSDLNALINGSVSAPKSVFKTYNTQGKKSYLAYKTKITDNDKQIFTDFNKVRFTADMSAYHRIKHTFMFIHKNVTYATGGLWSKISGSTYADAIFNKRLGQCAQYNGAMVEYLANLGFNTKIIWGYRGKSNDNKWQHFWGEVKLINGKTYVIETGNYGNDGNWNYFFTPYKNTKKYLKCGKYVSGIK